MTPSKVIYQPGGKRLKLGVQQTVIFAIMVVFFAFFIYRVAVPWGVSAFVLHLFEPSGEKANKVGFVPFGGSGKVWASVPKEKEKEFLANKNLVIKKELINKDYIFDFTFADRKEDRDGYEKEGGFINAEFYAKAENLGENPIILEPVYGFSIIAIVFGLVIAVLITIALPPSIGFMSTLFERQVDFTKIKIRLQTGFSNEIVDLLVMPDNKLAEKELSEVRGYFHLIWDRTHGEDSASSQIFKFDDVFNENIDLVSFRKDILFERIREFFSDFVLKEIEDTSDGVNWRDGRWKIGKGLRLYMAHHFTEKYSNNVTAMAYGGAAILIVAVGIRGLKFIPPQRPSMILLAIFLEFSMLSLLAVTMFYTEEEERMDKMLKKMEDANRSQLEVLRDQKVDMHLLSSVLVGQASDIIKDRIQKAVVEYLTKANELETVIGAKIGEYLQEALRNVALHENERTKTPQIH